MSESLTRKDALCRRVPSTQPKPGAMFETLHYPRCLRTDQWEQTLGTHPGMPASWLSPGLALPSPFPLDIFLRGND